MMFGLQETAVMENAGTGHLRWLMRIAAVPVPSNCDECVLCVFLRLHWEIVQIW